MAIRDFAVLVLLTFATAPAWANLPLGPRLGWDRGGLPVLIVAFFAALTASGSVALAPTGDADA